MKHLLFYFTFLFSLQAGAAGLPDQTVQYLRNKNMLVNPGFENGLASWVKSGGTSSLDKTTPLAGTASARWSSSAAGQTFSSAAHTLQSGGAGKNGFASCLIQVPTGTSTHKLQAFDGTSVLAERTITTSTVGERTHLVFKFPATGSVRLRLISVAAAEPAIGIDNCFMGILLPETNVTTAQKVALNPVEGLQVYDTDIHQVQVYNGAAWVALGGGGGGGGGSNLLALNGGNFDAESGGIGGLTNSGGTLSALTVNPLNGLASFRFVSSAVGQFVDSPLYPTPAGFSGRKCQVHFPYYQSTNATAAATDFALQVVDSAGNILATVNAPTTIAPATGNLFQAFDCPATGTQIKYRVISTTSAATFTWDDAFLGQGRNGINTFGPIVTGWQTGNCAANTTWTTNTTVTCNFRRVGDMAEVQENLYLTGAPNNTALFLGVPAGLTIDLTKYAPATANFARNWLGGGQGFAGSAYNFTVNQLQSGATNAVEVTYVFNSSSAESSVVATTPITWAAGNHLQFFYRIPVQGWSAERAPVEGNTYETSGWQVDATIAGTTDISAVTFNGSGFSSLNTVYESANLVLTNVTTGQGLIPAQIACTAGQASVGTTCPGNRAVGIAFNLPKAGDYEVCVAANHYLAYTSSINVSTYDKLVETLNTSSTPIPDSGGRAVSAGQWTNQIGGNPINFCERFTSSTAGLKTIRLLQDYRHVSGASTFNGILFTGQGGALPSPVRFTVRPVNESTPAPIFNEVRSKLNAVPNQAVYTAYITCNTSTCAIVRQTNAWLTAATRNTTGVARLVYTPGLFALPPVCSATPAFPSGVTPTGMMGIYYEGTTSLYAGRSNASPAIVDGDFTINCLTTF